MSIILIIRFEYDEDGVKVAKKYGVKPIVYFPNIRANIEFLSPIE